MSDTTAPRGNPILMGQAEVIDELPPAIRFMVDAEGMYLCGDTEAPEFTVPMVSMGGRIFSMKVDEELDPTRFKDTVTVTGPFFKLPEVTEAAGRAPIKLLQCPFCGGPPVPFVEIYIGGGPAPQQADYGDEGLFVQAYVWCHECGAQGSHTDTKTICSFEEYLEVERQGVDLWQARGSLHNIGCYQGGEAQGLSLYPRPDHLEHRTKLLEEVRANRERDTAAFLSKHGEEG